MAVLKYVFVLLHILTAAAWFGLALSLSAQSRAAVQHSGGAAVLQSGGRAMRQMGVFLLLTFAFALGAFFLGGGFSVYGPAYHTSITVMLILIGVQFLLIRTSWNKLEAALQTGDTTTARARRKRLAMGVGIGHALWLVLLVLMYLTQIVAILRT